VQATGAAGTLSPGVGNTVVLTGVEATGAAGSTEAVIAVPMVGQEAVGAVSTFSPQIVAALTGEEAVGAAGTLTPIAGAAIALTGVQGTGAVGQPGVSVTATDRRAVIIVSEFAAGNVVPGDSAVTRITITESS
jgi:hypothetical protein